MRELEDLFQERLERLEAGEPLELCLKGLPEQEAGLLKFAAMLRQAPYPERDPARATSQRSSLLDFAARQASPHIEIPELYQEGWEPAWLSWLRERLDWLLSRKAFAGSLAVLVVFSLLFFASLWLGASRLPLRDTSWVRSQEAPAIAEAPLAEVDRPVPGLPAAGGTGADSVADGRRPLVNAAETNAPAQAAAKPGFTAFIPVVSLPLNLNPQTAAIQDIQGIVEVQTSDGKWAAVNRVGTVKAGQRVRTAKLSSATLTFFDGSTAHLGPDSEISVDKLDAQLPQDGFRTIVLTQWVGESEHHIEFRNDRGSLYEVNTPAGSGVARGTTFRVLVTPDLRARFTVIEGKVDVTNLQSTVSVVAGQMTTAMAGRAPNAPHFRVSGEGEVSQIGDIWIIAGQEFQTDENTVIIGNPQVGDLVRVEGHLGSNGERIADVIILLHHAVNNRFTLTGEVTDMGASTWIVAGKTISISTDAVIDDTIVLGSLVRVDGVIAADGALVAESIALAEQAPGLPFNFTGVVQIIDAGAWTISDKIIEIVTDTVTTDGIMEGDLVEVRGWIMDDGSWQASEIKLVHEDEQEFTFIGEVETMDPWLVAGIEFETRDWTVIEPDIKVGDLVRVTGSVLPDGTWVAATIDLIDGDSDLIIVLVGIVESMDPWTINGITIVVDENTTFSGDISEGDLVWVEIQLSPDGTWVATSIRAINEEFGQGCLWVSAVVVGVSGDQILLKNWPPIHLDDDIKVEGEIKEDSVITFQICILFDGTIIVGDIIVIFQPVIIIVPAPPAPPPPPPGSNSNGNDNDNRNHNG
ncbi:MAG: DUF5666 domain-containing protein [Anaerolineae bacterium]